MNDELIERLAGRGDYRDEGQRRKMSERETEPRQMTRDELINHIIVLENRAVEACMVMDWSIGDLVPKAAATSVSEWQDKAREAMGWLRGENDPTLEYR